MEESVIIAALSALAHPSRLGVFRLLMKAGPAGLCAGDIAREIESRANTLSANLNLLAAAGLIVSRRDGRQIYYSVDHMRMRDVLAFLIEDCCDGRPEICDGLLPGPRPC